MALETFVDTSGFFAALAKRDSKHEMAARYFENALGEDTVFVTSDYVLDETATLLKARGLGHLVPRLFATIDNSKACRVCWTDPARFQAVRAFFRKHLDQSWSFTDCLSFLIMRERRINEALTTDHHFREAGFVPLLV